MNQQDKKTIDKIKLELLIKNIMVQESTPDATVLKYELIMALINSNINYINVINYYYDIMNILNDIK